MVQVLPVPTDKLAKVLGDSRGTAKAHLTTSNWNPGTELLSHQTPRSSTVSAAFPEPAVSEVHMLGLSPETDGEAIRAMFTEVKSDSCF